MKYLHIPAGDSPFSTDKEPNEDDYQTVEDGDLHIIRWNEEQKCFFALSCEGQTHPDDDSDDPILTWSISWEKL